MTRGGVVFKVTGGRFPVLYVLGMVLCCLLAFGCVTSRESDYMASAISEAMQEPLVADQQPVSALAEETPEFSSSTPTLVSVSPGGTVTATPALGVSITTPTQLTLVVPAPVTSTTTVAPEPLPVVRPSATTGASSGRVSTKVEPPVETDGELVAPVTPAFTPPVRPPSAGAAVPVAPEAAITPAESETPVTPAATEIASAPSRDESKGANVPVTEVPNRPATSGITGWHTGMLKPATPTIQPDSVLWISIAEDPSLNGRYSVNNSSAIDFGYVGLVFLQDMSVEQAESAIKNVLEGRYLNHATVSVKIAKASYDFVGVLGNVEVPGEIKIGPGATITLNDALRRAGGLRGNRESNRVKIVRGGLRTPFGPAAEGEVLSLVTEGGQLRIPEVFLRNNDLVYTFASESPQLGGTTKPTSKRVILLGEVPRRGVVEFAENEPCTLMYLLFKIGGLPRFAKGDKIQIVRRGKDGREKAFIANGESLMNEGNPQDDVVLESGDRVIVPARKIAFF